jgi:hypothetical protein
MSGRAALRNTAVALGAFVLMTMTMAGAAQAQSVLGPFCVTLADEPTTYRFTLFGILDGVSPNFDTYGVNGVRFDNEPGVTSEEFSPVTGTMFVRDGKFRISLTEHLGEAFDGTAQSVFNFSLSTFLGTYFTEFWETGNFFIDGGDAAFLFQCPSFP